MSARKPGFGLKLGLKSIIMASNEKTSKTVASKAGKLLKSKKTSKAVKSVAASALTQAPDKKKKTVKKK